MEIVIEFNSHYNARKGIQLVTQIIEGEILSIKTNQFNGRDAINIKFLWPEEDRLISPCKRLNVFYQSVFRYLETLDLKPKIVII